MKRVPEPELMDEPDQARAYAEADFDQPNALFVDTFTRCFPDFNCGRVLDVGCGPADIPIRFAGLFPELNVVAVDGAQSMISLADRAIERAGMSTRIRALCWRIGQEPGPGVIQGRFDGVISNSLLHHLDEPDRLWRAISKYAKIQAPVLVMDLRRPRSQNAAREIVEEYSGNEPEILKRDFYHSLLAAYREDEVREQLIAAGLSYFNVERISDRHLVAYGRLSAG